MGNATATSTTTLVDTLNGDVEVRRIPPKLLREIQTKVTKGGRLDFQELLVWKIVYGVKEPNFTEAEARELTRRYSMRTLGPIIDRIDELSGTDEHLSNLDVPPRFRKFVEPVVMARAWIERFPADRPIVARGPRARGAGRPRAKRSATARGDPDEPPGHRPPSREGAVA